MKTLHRLLKVQNNALLKSFLFLLLFATGLSSFAQIVNIENQRLHEKQNGWHLDSDLNFMLMKNLAIITQFGNRNKVFYKYDQHTVLLMTDLSLVKVNDNKYINSGFAHARYSYNSNRFEKLYYEGFLQTQYNRVQYLKVRNLAGAGARFEVVKLDSFAVNTGAFVMGEYEVETDETIHQTARYSCFLSFDYQFNKSTGINSITYYQPDFLDPSDFRISSETSFRVKINKHLSLRVVYNLYYDTNPPQTIPTTFYTLSNAINVHF